MLARLLARPHGQQPSGGFPELESKKREAPPPPWSDGKLALETLPRLLGLWLRTRQQHYIVRVTYQHDGIYSSCRHRDTTDDPPREERCCARCTSIGRPNHELSVFMLNSWDKLPGWPSTGSWDTYGLVQKIRAGLRCWATSRPEIAFRMQAEASEVFEHHHGADRQA
jgi:hypothetical protein